MVKNVMNDPIKTVKHFKSIGKLFIIEMNLDKLFESLYI